MPEVFELTTASSRLTASIRAISACFASRVFHDGFDDPVRLARRHHVLVKAARADERQRRPV